MTILSKSIRYIALVAALAMLAVSASADLKSLPTVRTGSHELYYYDVKRGDSLYSIAENLGVSRDFIVANNPSAADGVKPLMRLYFPMAADAAATRDSSVPDIPATHIVGKGESIYGISALYGVPVETLIRLNPQADSGVKAGQVLRLIEAAQQPAMTTQPEQSASDKPAAKATKEKKKKDKKKNKNKKDKEGQDKILTDTIKADTVAAQAADSMAAAYDQLPAITPAEEVEASIAVLLPFMSADDNPGRSAQLHSEFLRGMLLAAEKASQRRGAKITLRAFDTCNDIDTLRSLLAYPEVYTADIIIAPDAPAQIEAIEEGAPQARILNFLSVRDESYLDHPNVVQANIPHDDMYATAIKGFMQVFANHTPVFLRRDVGAADKDEFTAALRKALDEAGRPYREVMYNAMLEDSDLAAFNPDREPVVFVPNTGKLNEFTRFADGLTHLRERSSTQDGLALWGYPEWVTFSGDALASMGNLNTTIYSRFYIVPDDFDAKAIARDYRDWYGIDMIDAIPSQGILGYDATNFAIDELRAMAQQGTDKPVTLDFEGVQNTLKLERATESPDAGMVNRSLFFIHYLPGGRVEKTRF